MSSPKILLVDDEASIIKLVSAYLKPEGYEVLTALDGPSGLHMALSLKPDLVVLDIMLPGMDGLEVLSRLRRESNVYVILMTAKTEETDRVIGLSMGADDYVLKPFSPRELTARIKAALRRLNSETSDGYEVITFKHIRIEKGSRRVWQDEKLIQLTAVEFDLVKTLGENHHRVLTRDQLLDKVWGQAYYGEKRVVDVHIGHIRRKGLDKFIQTLRGVGYIFEDEPV